MNLKIIFTAVCFFILSCIVFFISLKYTKSIAQDNLENEIVKVKQSFSESIKSTQVIVSSYQILFSSLDKIDKKSFQNYSENIMKEFKFVQAVAFHLEVPESKKITLSKQFPEGIIDEVHENGETKFSPSKNSQFYYPLLFVDKTNEDGAAIGWNAAADPLRAKAIELSLKNNKPVASKTYLLPNGDVAFDIYFPVFNKEVQHSLVSLTVSIPQLLGDTKWFQNVDLILSLALEGSSNKVDIFKHLDKESTGFLNIGNWKSEISITNFGQENILKFEKIFYLNRVKYGILILTFFACLLVSILSCYLVRSYGMLEIKVKLRTKELKHTNEEIHEILNNLQDAVFIINNKFIIQHRYSPATKKLLGVSNPQGKNSKEILFTHLDNTNEDISRHLFAFESVMNATPFQWDISQDDLLKTMPYFKKDTENGELIKKTLSLKYTPFFENNNLVKLLIVASDLSEIIQLRESFEQQQEISVRRNTAINELISADKKLIQEFFENSKELIKAPSELIELEKQDETNLNQVFRDLHTFKGNSRSLQLSQLGKIIHEAEDKFVVFKSNVDTKSKNEFNIKMSECAKIFNMYYEIVEQIFHTGKNLDVPRNTVEKIAKWISQEKQNPKVLEEFIFGILNNSIFSLVELFNTFNSMVENIALSLEKKVELVYDVQNVYFKNEILISIRNSLTHIIRNSIDHGIEVPTDRINKNKNEIGRIEFKINKKQKSFQLIICDDGQGVSLSKVYAIAKNKELTIKNFTELTQGEILEFLFLPGFSTKQNVTELSGRGVGLDAVRSELTEVGITVTLKAEEGMGTSFFLDIPMDRVCFLEEGQTLNTAERT